MKFTLSQMTVIFAILAAYCIHAEEKVNFSNAVQQDSECPVWYYCDQHNNTCVCGSSASDIIRCDPANQVALVQDCSCVTVDQENKETIAGACFANCGNSVLDKRANTAFRTLMKNKSRQNSFMCGSWHRTGDLCGRCEDEHYQMAYSYNQSCIRCENGCRNWAVFVAAAYIPLTVFYFFVVFFKLNVTTSSLHGFIFVAQVLSMPPTVQTLLQGSTGHNQLQNIVKVLSSLYGIWNLDFFRAFTTGICLEIDSLPMLALDYTIAVFPLLLSLLSYQLIELHDRNFRILVLVWKPFRHLLMLFRRNWNSRTSVVDAYSTFFTLSYVKFPNVSFDILTFTRVYRLSSKETYLALYNDPTKKYFKEDHLPYAILALSVLFFFNILPIIVLSLYQFSWFQKALSCLPIKHHILNIFVDSFQGCYKDGTESGTRDFHWFSAMYLILRLLGFVVYALLRNYMYYVFGVMILLVFAVILVTIQPYKASSAHYTPINVSFVLLLAFFYTSIVGINIASAKNQSFIQPCIIIGGVCTVLPLVYISVFVMRWLFTRRRFGLELVGRIRALRAGYEWWTTDDTTDGTLPDRIANPHMYHDRNLTYFISSAD